MITQGSLNDLKKSGLFFLLVVGIDRYLGNTVNIVGSSKAIEMS